VPRTASSVGHHSLRRHLNETQPGEQRDQIRSAAKGTPSGVDGDVVDPSNILWLRHSTADAYVQSFARAGYLGLDVRES